MSSVGTMAIIDGSNSTVEEVSSSSSREGCVGPRQTGTTKLKNYVLNDVAALKKKLQHEKRTTDFHISKEAKDLSNIVIQMRASFFEYMKSHLLEELESNQNILKIENAERSKAMTESSGEAFEEYSLDITFEHSGHSHSVKLTAYTTTSQILYGTI